MAPYRPAGEFEDDAGPEPIDELDPRFSSEHDDRLADWRRARLLEERMREVPRPGVPVPPAHGGIDAVPAEPPEPTFGGPPPAIESRQGRRAAQALRRRLGVPGDQRRFDLDAHLDAEDLFVKELPAAHGAFTAALWRHDDGYGGAIFLAAGQSPTRARFSIAHELGHYHMPMHHALPPSSVCSPEHLARGIVVPAGSPAARRNRPLDVLRDVVEAEANDFAAELLMPVHLIAADIARRDLSVETALRLAGEGMYDVSLVAAAWRVVQVTDEACALVMSSGGVVRWMARSRNCPDLAFAKAVRLSAESAAGAVTRGESPRVRPERVPPHAWLAEPSECRGPVLESTFRLAAAKQVLSMLWMPELRS